LESAVAAQEFEVVIHMPQRKITGNGGLRDHKLRQRDGDPRRRIVLRKNSILISLDAASPTAITSRDEKLYLRKVL
jgi:hypothetical protein